MNKDSVQDILDGQTDPIDVDAFLEQLILRQKIEQGEADLAAGRVVNHEDAKKRLSRWLE